MVQGQGRHPGFFIRAWSTYPLLQCLIVPTCKNSGSFPSKPDLGAFLAYLFQMSDHCGVSSVFSWRSCYQSEPSRICIDRLTADPDTLLSCICSLENEFVAVRVMDHICSVKGSSQGYFLELDLQRRSGIWTAREWLELEWNHQLCGFSPRSYSRLFCEINGCELILQFKKCCVFSFPVLLRFHDQVRIVYIQVVQHDCF